MSKERPGTGRPEGWGGQKRGHPEIHKREITQSRWSKLVTEGGGRNVPSPLSPSNREQEKLEGGKRGVFRQGRGRGRLACCAKR